MISIDDELMLAKIAVYAKSDKEMGELRTGRQPANETGICACRCLARQRAAGAGLERDGPSLTPPHQ
jgi:hypothetical protein